MGMRHAMLQLNEQHHDPFTMIAGWMIDAIAGRVIDAIAIATGSATVNNIDAVIVTVSCLPRGGDRYIISIL